MQVLRLFVKVAVPVASGMCVVAALYIVVWPATLRCKWARDTTLQAARSRPWRYLETHLVGRRHSPYAALDHVGRRSGHPYTTAVGAVPFGDGFAIPLTYGHQVQWCRNVMAAGTCTLTWQATVHALEHPEVIPMTTVDVLPPWLRMIVASGGIREALWLHRVRRP